MGSEEGVGVGVGAVHVAGAGVEEVAEAAVEAVAEAAVEAAAGATVPVKCAVSTLEAGRSEEERMNHREKARAFI